MDRKDDFRRGCGNSGNNGHFTNNRNVKEESSCYEGQMPPLKRFREKTERMWEEEDNAEPLRSGCFPDWSLKLVQRCQAWRWDDEFEVIRIFLDSLSDEQLCATGFSFVHFSKYCDNLAISSSRVPAEFCCVQFSIDKGIEWFGGSPIDPGEGAITDWIEGKDNARALSLPLPPYTYQRGAAYSVGEDRFDAIVMSIYEHGTSFKLDENQVRIPFKYVFASENNVADTVGCLTWLMAHCDKDPRLRVLPIERFLSELYRTCQLRRFLVDLKAKVVEEMEEMLKKQEKGKPPSIPSASLLENSIRNSELPPISEAQDATIKFVSSIRHVENVIHGPSLLRSRIRLGCMWHQRESSCGSISSCSTTICKRWVILASQKAVEILHKEGNSSFEQDLDKPDIRPITWGESDAIGVEARQRFGFYGKISEKRVKVLEDGFVFPNLLEELKKRMPNGMKRKPERIIWPLDRNIEEDLNWCPVAQFYIYDTEAQERRRKLEERMAEWRVKNERQDDW